MKGSNEFLPAAHRQVSSPSRRETSLSGGRCFICGSAALGFAPEAQASPDRRAAWRLASGELLDGAEAQVEVLALPGGEIRHLCRRAIPQGLSHGLSAGDLRDRLVEPRLTGDTSWGKA